MRRSTNFWSILSVAITISAGIITVLGLLVGDQLGLLSTLVTGLGIRTQATILLRIAAITIALTLFIGILNLLAVHVERIVTRRSNAFYSVALILSFFLVIGMYVVQRASGFVILQNLQISIESALAALLLFALVYGAATITRRRRSLTSIWFVGVVLIVLIGAIPLGEFAVVTQVRDWLLTVPVNAGARGILLGIALATLVAGVRVLIGLERSYRE
ncbi:MAG: hypothetical protein MUF87_00135 [Anaerolineae bacterium]|nr:hypothetical protein [Anaerolineae bacterium]